MDSAVNKAVVEDAPEIVVGESEEDQKLKYELMKMGIPALTQFLDRFGYQAKPETPKRELVEAIMRIQETRLKESEDCVQKAIADSQEEDDPMVWMIFENLESPGTDLEFSYRKTGFRDGKRLKPLPRWHFFPGHRYSVPLSVVEHLNNLRVPVDKKVSENADGMIRNIYPEAKQNRFSCRIEFTDEQKKMLSKGK